MSYEELALPLVDLGEAASTPPQWIVENQLICGLTVLGGPPKVGKSTWTMSWAALLAEWHCQVMPPFLSKATKPGPTLILSAEASAAEMRHTLEFGLRTKCVPDGSILVMENEEECQLDDEEGLQNLLRTLDELDPRLCVLDPFRDFHSQEEKDSAAIIRLLKPLRRWAKENDSAFVVVHHTGKPPMADRKDYRFSATDLRGSGAIFGKADGVIMLTPRKEGDSTNVHVSAVFKRAKAWETELHLAAWDSELEQGEEKMKDVDRTFVRLLKQGVSAEAIGAQLQMGKNSIREVMYKLERNGLWK